MRASVAIEDYRNKKPCGVYSINYDCGFYFYEPYGYDKGYCDLVVAEVIGGVAKNFKERTVRYDDNGEPFITLFRNKVYLSDIMRNN